MRQTRPETQLESIARDVAVKADGLADPSRTNARFGDALRRIYAPVDEGQADRFGYLLSMLDHQLSGCAS